MAFVELKDVRKSYHMGEITIHAVDGISFAIEKGEFVVIVGPSGEMCIRDRAIVAHLSSTLDHQYEVAGGLASLYEYFNYQILQANIKKSPEPVEEVLPMIAELKEAFSQADKQVRMGHTG